MLNEVLFYATTYTGNNFLYMCGIYSVHPVIASSVGASVLTYATVKSVPFITRKCSTFIKNRIN